MKPFLLLLILIASHPFAFSAPQEAKRTYQPAPIDNPLKGLVPYAGPTPDRFPHSMEFGYIDFNQLVTGPEQYDFAPLEKLLNDIKSRGNQTVFRVRLEQPGDTDMIPAFLIDAGLKLHRYLNTNTAPFPPKEVVTPDYSNPLLRKTLQAFIAELGKRYDGDPRIAYITAGLLGTWGEWHTYPRMDLWADKTTQTEVMDAYQKAFSKTPILLRYPAGKDNYHYAQNSDRPFGFHDDSFAWATLDTGKKEDDWFFQPALKAAGLEAAWKRVPIGGEIRPEVWGCCFDQPPCTPKGQEFEPCRDALHVTWLMDTGLFREAPSPERKKRAEDAVRGMGYEYQVEHVVRDGEDVTLQVINRGIAPFYHPGWKAEFAVADKNGQIQRRWTSSWDLPQLLPDAPAKPLTTSLSQLNDFRGMQLLVRIPNPMPGGKSLRFANKAQDPKSDGWLRLMEIK